MLLNSLFIINMSTYLVNATVGQLLFTVLLLYFEKQLHYDTANSRMEKKKTIHLSHWEWSMVFT